jgi:hypothetical protein
LALASSALAQSQPRQPEPSADGTQQPTAADPRGTDASPLIVKVQPAPKTDAEAAEEQRQKDQGVSDRNWTRGLAIVTAALGLLQLIAIGFQVGIARKQNRIIERQNTIMDAQRLAAETQSGYMSDGLIETRKAADAAANNAKAAADNATSAAEATLVNSAALATNREIERAYIRMAHRDVTLIGIPDGQGGEDMSKPKGLSFTMRLENTGRTPGDLLGGYFGFTFGDEGPKTPDLATGARLGPAFLYPEKYIDFKWTIWCSRMPELANALAGHTPMWLIGVAEYEDRFGGLHSAGYSRKLSDDNREFVFSQETGPFNYDRPMPDEIRGHYGKHKSQEPRP